MLALLIALSLLVSPTDKKETKEVPRVSLRVRAVDSKGGVHEVTGFSGQMMRITANVRRANEHRILDTAVDCSSGFFRSWGEALEGEKAEYSRENNVGPMPSGYCTVLAQVAYIDPKEKSGIGYYLATTEMCFVGGDTTCQREF